MVLKLNGQGCERHESHVMGGEDLIGTMIHEHHGPRVMFLIMSSSPQDLISDLGVQEHPGNSSIEGYSGTYLF